VSSLSKVIISSPLFLLKTDLKLLLLTGTAGCFFTGGRCYQAE